MRLDGQQKAVAPMQKEAAATVQQLQALVDGDDLVVLGGIGNGAKRAAKVLGNVLQARLLKFVMARGLVAPNQFGFMPGKRAEDAAWVLQCMIHDRWSLPLPAGVAASSVGDPRLVWFLAVDFSAA